jgi:hypothetical protein
MIHRWAAWAPPTSISQSRAGDLPRPKPMSDWQAAGRLLKQIDEHARAHGETCSGFLTKAALEAMRRA